MKCSINFVRDKPEKLLLLLISISEFELVLMLGLIILALRSPFLQAGFVARIIFIPLLSLIV